MSKSTQRKRSTSGGRQRARTNKGKVRPALKPVKLTKARLAKEKTTKKTDGSGPLEWLLPMLETSYTPLTQEGTPDRAVSMAVPSSLDSAGAALAIRAQPTIW